MDYPMLPGGVPTKPQRLPGAPGVHNKSNAFTKKLNSRFFNDTSMVRRTEVLKKERRAKMEEQRKKQLEEDMRKEEELVAALAHRMAEIERIEKLRKDRQQDREQRRRHHRAALRLQQWVKAILHQREVNRLNGSAIVLQRRFRCQISKLDYARKKSAVLNLQRWLRARTAIQLCQKQLQRRFMVRKLCENRVMAFVIVGMSRACVIRAFQLKKLKEAEALKILERFFSRRLKPWREARQFQRRSRAASIIQAFFLTSTGPDFEVLQPDFLASNEFMASLVRQSSFHRQQSKTGRVPGTHSKPQNKQFGTNKHGNRLKNQPTLQKEREKRGNLQKNQSIPKRQPERNLGDKSNRANQCQSEFERRRSTSSQPGINSRAAVLGNGGNLWQPPPPPFAKILSKDRLEIEKIHAEREEQFNLEAEERRRRAAQIQHQRRQQQELKEKQETEAEAEKRRRIEEYMNDLRRQQLIQARRAQRKRAQVERTRALLEKEAAEKRRLEEEDKAKSRAERAKREQKQRRLRAERAIAARKAQQAERALKLQEAGRRRLQHLQVKAADADRAAAERVRSYRRRQSVEAEAQAQAEQTQRRRRRRGELDKPPLNGATERKPAKAPVPTLANSQQRKSATKTVMHSDPLRETSRSVPPETPRETISPTKSRSAPSFDQMCQQNSVNGVASMGRKSRKLHADVLRAQVFEQSGIFDSSSPSSQSTESRNKKTDKVSQTLQTKGKNSLTLKEPSAFDFSDDFIDCDDDENLFDDDFIDCDDVENLLLDVPFVNNAAANEHQIEIKIPNNLKHADSNDLNNFSDEEFTDCEDDDELLLPFL